MQPSQDLLQQARAEHESHLQTCRQCRADGVPCTAAEHLRRLHNNLARQARSVAGTRAL
ncbi:hypothetical protein ACF061_20910 [Streptomyces sp. NPDC015220]|uniref:hypothetical protein n=1 Tax=Streptomyces sp. NPDC015220 TaxID=3364947 RepID=UPI0036F72EAB